MKKDIFVGGGLPSLIMALYLIKNFPKKNIVIIERGMKLGGANGSVYYGNNEVFDYGMRVYYECNIEEIDEIVENSLSEKDILIHEGNKKDPAGCFFNGKLQKNTPCIDLRFLNSDDRVTALGELLTSKLNIEKSDYHSAKEYLLDKFGNTICRKGFFPILERLHGRPIFELNIEASSIHFGMEERVVLFDEDITKDLMESSILRKRLAYPDQNNLPEKFSKRVGRAIYPRKLGMQNIINGLEEQLLGFGVEFFLGTELDYIKSAQNRIEYVTCKNFKTKEIAKLEVENLYCNGSIHILANKLGYKNNKRLDTSDKTYLMHYVFDKNININGLYYIFNFDKKYSTFRVVNYSQYCPDSSLDGKYRVTVECWPHGEELSVDSIFSELICMRIIDSDTKIIFAQQEVLLNGFPLPTLRNKNIILEYRNFLKKQDISNLLVFGQSVEDNTFFLPGIMMNAYNVFKKHNLVK